jgi:predicted NAD/FAD-binding protein
MKGKSAMKIAIIGTGISGLVTAYLLSRKHDITVFEADNRIGGHTHTVDVKRAESTVPVDTGFIVFNEKTYPHFIKLMALLGVAWQPSNMSFSVQCDMTGLVYCPSTLNSLFAQRRNLIRPSFYRMLWDAIRFRRTSLSLLDATDDRMPISEYLEKNNYSRGFIEQFIIPMGASIWSSNPDRFMDFPVRYMVYFFHHHGFLNIRNQPQWRTIKGGSKQYIAPLINGFEDSIRLNCPVKKISRSDKNVTLTLANDGTLQVFDQVVIATHSDQALKLLADPSEAEHDILGDIPYQENLTVLHTDAAMMPACKAAWASWNYRQPKDKINRVALTYYMNLLQNLPPSQQFFVTLNMSHAIDTAKRIKELVYHHPIYDPKGLAARKRHAEINGTNRTWYCGAYWGYGFHEDGVNSALEVCKNFGEKL